MEHAVQLLGSRVSLVAASMMFIGGIATLVWVLVSTLKRLRPIRDPSLGPISTSPASITSIFVIIIAIQLFTGWYVVNYSFYNKLMNLGNSAYGNEDYARAAVFYARAANLKPEESTAYVWLSLAQLHNGQVASSIQNCNTALLVHPEGAFERLNCAIVFGAGASPVESIRSR